MKILKSQIKNLGLDEGTLGHVLEALRQDKVDHLMSGEIGASPPSHPILDQFIKRTPTGPDTPDEFTIDYEIINDDPPPPTEAELKTRALHELRAQEQVEIAALVPANKIRLMQMEVNRASQVPEADRTKEHVETIAHWQALQKTIEDIQYAYAKREAAL